jgi:hypothetical protein
VIFIWTPVLFFKIIKIKIRRMKILKIQNA